MSDPRSPEGMKPETPESDGPDTTATGGEQTAGGNAGIGAEGGAPKAKAYVDPEIALEAQLLAWEAEKADLTEKLLRAHAEMDNLRKRTEREKADMSKYAITRFAGDMLAVADNLERALAAMPKIEELEPHTKALIEGVELTGQDLRKALERHNVLRIEALNALFDPNFHQAVMEEENKDVAAGTVTRVLQEGYRIGERVLRPSMVVVARGGFKPVKGDAAPAENPKINADPAEARPGEAGAGGAEAQSGQGGGEPPGSTGSGAAA
jgi:molecular chaperone GrpE